MLLSGHNPGLKAEKDDALVHLCSLGADDCTISSGLFQTLSEALGTLSLLSLGVQTPDIVS